jgi:uncharacterized metal-binding protein
MPQAKTHDLITLILAPPTYIATLQLTDSSDLAILATISMLFAGLMFGPDLDIQSKQYARWGPFGFLWWPYRFIFRHRSRLSHGILLGTAIRVAYFAAMLIIVAAVGLFVIRLIVGDAVKARSLQAMIVSVWQSLTSVDRRYLLATFIGLWWGATSHTLTDWLWGIWTNTRKIF